jgi:hypothetical protein
MKQTIDSDPYWTHNFILGEGNVEGHQSLIRLHMHRSEETYEHSIENLFPISSRRSNRSYFHATPHSYSPHDLNHEAIPKSFI